MSKDAKDPKQNKPDGVRQPQRKDSLSSVLSWAALQGKITVSKTPTASSSAPSAQASPGNGTRPRRHSHSASTETKTKARRGSTKFRRFSFSISTTIQDGASTKTRHSKTSMTPDPKAAPGTSKSAKNGSLEKVNKPAAESPDGKNTLPPRPQSAQGKLRSPGLPVPMPKSILRVSSPDGHRYPRQFVNLETGEPTSPGLPPSSSPVFGTMSPDSPPGSPPTSPIHRPMSPGATVRFAKATIHRVEVGPGRRFLPVKRKSKSTLTYISPLDPGTQKSAPKTMLQSPTKLRRHQENQAAMGRYWLRTEEEEAQWRAEAERRAEEEAERYRNEPASPPPPSAAAAEAALEEVAGVKNTLADKIAAIDKLPPLDSGPALDKVEEVESEDEDTDDEAGARCNQEEIGTGSTLRGSAEGQSDDGESTDVKVEEGEITEEPKKQDAKAQSATQTAKVKVGSPILNNVEGEASDFNATTSTMVPQGPAAKPAVNATTAVLSSRTGDTKPAESKSFSERLAEKQAAEARAIRPPSPTTSRAESWNANTPPAAYPVTEKLARSPSSSPSKEQLGASSSGRSSTTSTTSMSSDSSTSSAEQLAKSPSSRDGKEKAKERTKTAVLSTGRSSMNLRSSSGGGSSSRADRTLTSTRGNNSHSHGSGSSSGSSGSSNHLHLSGRRGRRYFEDHKQGITA